MCASQRHLACIDILLDFEPKLPKEALSLLFGNPKLFRFGSASIDSLARKAKIRGFGADKDSQISKVHRKKASKKNISLFTASDKVPPPEKFCFFVLEELLSQSGYRENLRARNLLLQTVPPPLPLARPIPRRSPCAHRIQRVHGPRSFQCDTRGCIHTKSALNRAVWAIT